MKNRIITIIVLILVFILVISMLYGIELGSLKIFSISQLKQKNDDVQAKIQEVNVLTSVNYTENVQTLEETYEKLELNKQKYEEISSLSDTNDNKIYETKQYDIGYLWKLVADYSKSRNITIVMDVRNSGQTGIYNLQFSVAGQYVNISQFISDIENNSDLYFRIYNFKMTGSGNVVNASFTVKDININPSTIKASNTTK